MKYLRILILPLLLIVPYSSTHAQKITKESIVSEGKKRSYYIYVPKTVNSTPVPLLITLHGSGHDGASLVEKWKDMADKEGFILAGPDSRNFDGWSIPADGPQFIYDLAEALKAKYPINPRRVYLFGHSAGADFGIFMSLYESEYFAAVAVHAGALTKQQYPMIDLAKRMTPLAIFVGTNDPLYSLKDVRTTRDVLNERGFSVQLTEIKGHDHDYYSRADEINRGAWDFLKSYELSGDPQYTKHVFKK
jgi:poly(3-hydroxybutyrate) depolymerase